MNNYDRRYTREYVSRQKKSQSYRTTRRKKNKVGFGVKLFYTAFFAVFLLSLIGLMGGLGVILKKYLVGLFGLSAIGICIAGMLVCILRFLGFRLVKLEPRIAFFSVGILAVFLLFLQVITTVNLYVLLDSPSLFAYLSTLFSNGAKTSGGLIFGLISYPLIKYVGARITLVILAIAFFALIFFAFFPLMLEDKPTERKNVSENRQNHKIKEKKSFSLFVDSIDGKKNANKITKKSIFASKSRDGFDILNPNKEHSFDFDEEDTSKEYDDHDITSENPDTRKIAFKNMLFHMDDSQASAVFSEAKNKKKQVDKTTNTEYKKPIIKEELSSEDELPLFLGSRRIAQSKAHEMLYGDPAKKQKQLLSEDLNISRTLTPEDASSINYVNNSLGYDIPKQELKDILFENPNYKTKDKEIRTDGKFGLFGIRHEKAENKNSVPNLEDILAKLEPVKENNEQVLEVKTTRKKKEQRKELIKAEQISIYGNTNKERRYVAPSDMLLKEYLPPNVSEDYEEIAENLSSALLAYDIETEVVGHQRGPTFTQFAFRLPDGVSVRRVTSVETDIKRKLKTSEDIRIIPAIEGMDAFGIELPNQQRSTIGMKELINAPEFKIKKKLQFVLGVDVTGEPFYCDLLSMPHLLVAGSTGSGKSVCLNTIICSFLYHYSPDEVKFIMIDPKKVELNIYTGIPHMILKSTVTDCNKAVNALSWAITEMDRRYTMFQEMGCRSIHDYNDMQEVDNSEKLHYIVIIIDEMADLMTRARRDVEDKIATLASQARAAGIHLIVATQRPSVDIITGTIKNNIPTRIAFKVSSFADSKTILDKGGADKLFGKGDMLFMNAEFSEPKRLQGPYLSDEEVRNIVRFVKSNNKTSYDEEANKTIFSDKVAADDASTADPMTDELYEQAVRFVVESKVGSISMLQRKYKIGFNRAGRLIDAMSERGIVEEQDYGTSKPRNVLITPEDLDKILNNDGSDED